MEAPLEHPSYVEHAPEDLHLPSVPREQLRSLHSPNSVTLPNLQSILADFPHRNHDHHLQAEKSYAGRDAHWTSPVHARVLPQLDPSPRTYRGFRSSTDAALLSPSTTASVTGAAESESRSTSHLSLEDPDVRLAAEALSGLGNAGKHDHRHAN